MERSKRRGVGIALGVLLVIVSVVGCGDERPRAATDPGGGPGFGNVTGPCEPDGAVRECKVPLGSRDGIASCFVGVQECLNGGWTRCGGRDVTIASIPVDPQARMPGSGITFQALGTPSPTSPACNDPCDPYCQGFDGNPNATPPGVTVQADLPNPFGNGPPGHVGKQDCSPACDTGFPKKCNGEDHYSMIDACLADHHCDNVVGSPTKGQCVYNLPILHQWPSGASTAPPACNGIDLTVGAACRNLVTGRDGFPVCNRGSVKIPAGTVIRGRIANPASLGLNGCPAPAAPDCTGTLAADLNPGFCTRFEEGAECSGWAGNKYVYVWMNGTVAPSYGECTFAANPPAIPAATPGCVNNWADVKSGDTCAGVSLAVGVSTVTYNFDATCQVAGTRPVWKDLGFRVLTPCLGICTPLTQSTVRFEVRSSDTDIATGLPVTSPNLAVATAPTDHNPNCLAGSGNPDCAVDIKTPLGTASVYTKLEVTVTFDARGIAPTLQTLHAAYQCVPYE